MKNQGKPLNMSSADRDPLKRSNFHLSKIDDICLLFPLSICPFEIVRISDNFKISTISVESLKHDILFKAPH